MKKLLTSAALAAFLAVSAACDDSGEKNDPAVSGQPRAAQAEVSTVPAP